MKFEYCIAVCEDEPPVEVCYQDETAMGCRFPLRRHKVTGTYTPYVANTPLMFCRSNYWLEP